jgi:hypothetical protein
MSYALRTEQKPGYLHVVVTGENTRGNVVRYLQEVHRECEARDCWYVLIEERLEGPRLGTMDVFEIASQRERPLGGSIRGVAYVDLNTSGDLMKFAEDVAVNRGYPVRVFSAVDDAEKWLVARADAARKTVERS